MLRLARTLYGHHLSHPSSELRLTALPCYYLGYRVKGLGFRV